MLTFVAEIYHPSFLFDPNYSHDVNELSVSLTSYANFVVKGFFLVTVVKEMQVLLTTHKSTNFYNHLFLLIPLLVTAMQKETSKHLRIYSASSSRRIPHRDGLMEVDISSGSLEIWKMLYLCPIID